MPLTTAASIYTSLQPDNYPELFPYVLIAVSCNAFLAFLIPIVYTVRVRSQVFNKDFMSKFTEEH